VTVTQYQTDRKSKTVTPVIVTKMVTTTRTASGAVETGVVEKSKKIKHQQMVVVGGHNGNDNLAENDHDEDEDDEDDDDDDHDDDDDGGDYETKTLGVAFAVHPRGTPTTLYAQETYHTQNERNLQPRQQAVVQNKKVKTTTTTTTTTASTATGASSQYDHGASYFEWEDNNNANTVTTKNKTVAVKKPIVAITSPSKRRQKAKRFSTTKPVAVESRSVSLLELVYDKDLEAAKTDIKDTLKGIDNTHKNTTLSTLLADKYGTANNLALDIRANIDDLIGSTTRVKSFSKTWSTLLPVLTREFPRDKQWCVEAGNVNNACPKSPLADDQLRRAFACFAGWAAIGNYDVERCVVAHRGGQCSGPYGVEGCYRNLVLAERYLASKKGSWGNYFKWKLIPTSWRNNTKIAHQPNYF